MLKSRILEKIKKLPKSPGVYIFYGQTSARGGFRSAQVLYVGKATSLRSRARSYFVPSPAPAVAVATSPKGRGGNFSRPVETAIGQIADIKTIKTETVLEAFILEQNLIKKLQPKYNAMGKDDKSFSYVVIAREEFPRIMIMRGREIDQIFNFQFSRPQRFANNSVASDKKSEDASKRNANFKLALQSGQAIFKQIPINKFKIKNSFKIQNSKFKILKTYGPYTSKKQLETALKILRKIFPFHSSKQMTEKGCLEHQIGLCPGPYAGQISRTDYLKNIRGIQMILEGKKKSLVKKLEKEMREYSNRRQFEEAANLRNKIFALKHIQDVALITGDDNFQFSIYNFQTNSNLKIGFNPAMAGQNSKFRIEAYDISNISGQYAVGSMIVFDNSTGNFEPNKSEYRKFKIKTVRGADDVGMMREVLSRRFCNDWLKPDLIILDGGTGHLHMAEKLLKNLNLNIPLAAVTKGPTRKNLEIISDANPRINANPQIANAINNKNFVKQIMDEAHRFAITYHKKVRKKAFI